MLLDHDFDIEYPGCIYHYSMNDGNSTSNYDVCLKLLAKTADGCQRHHCGVNFEANFKVWSGVSIIGLEQAIANFFLNTIEPNMAFMRKSGSWFALATCVKNSGGVSF